MSNIGRFVIGILNILWEGVVLSTMWGWFVVPVLHLPPLGVVAAIGISLVVNLLISLPVCLLATLMDAMKVDIPVWLLMLVGTGFTTVMLVAGWFVHLFM